MVESRHARVKFNKISDLQNHNWELPKLTCTRFEAINGKPLKETILDRRRIKISS